MNTCSGNFLTTRRNLETSKLVLAVACIGKVSLFRRVKQMTVSGRYPSKVDLVPFIFGKTTDSCITYCSTPLLPLIYQSSGGSL